MATDYGTDLDGVLDWPDPEVLASGPRNLANALARRILTRNGAFTDIGDAEPYESLNLRDWLGARPSDGEVAALNTAMQQVLAQEERVETVTAAATFTAGSLSVSVSGTGTAGPFAFVVGIDAAAGLSLQVIR